MNPQMAASGFGLCMVGMFSAVITFSIPRESSPVFGLLLGFTIFLFVAGFWIATRDY